MHNEAAEEHDIFNFGSRRTMQADFDRVLAEVFGRALDASGAPPMSVLVAMASAVGAVYREVARHHGKEQCPCGWRPSFINDLELLCSALEETAGPQQADRLLTMPVQGQA